MSENEMIDYRKARKERVFDWFIGTSGNCFWTLAGIPVKDFYLDPGACIEAYRKGRPLVREMFGPDIPPAPLMTPMVKYGHVNAVGAEVNFPDGGEPHHVPPFSSLEEGIRRLEKTVDFAGAGLTPFFLEMRRKLQAAFPDEKVHWGWQWEGPITTAWELLGLPFMYDLLEKPEEMRRFLKLSTASIVEYCRFFCRIEGTEVLDPEPDHGRLCDDIAAMVPPQLWPEIVLPAWEMFYTGPTPARILHCEDMKPVHLQFLEQLALADYDPGISPKLNPQIIHANTRVPFAWRLGGFHYRSMSCEDVRDFVRCAAVDGASSVFTWIEAAMCNEETVPKVRAFIDTARETTRLIRDGAGREEIAERITAAGRRKFWAHWLD